MHSYLSSLVSSANSEASAAASSSITDPNERACDSLLSMLWSADLCPATEIVTAYDNYDSICSCRYSSIYSISPYNGLSSSCAAYAQTAYGNVTQPANTYDCRETGAGTTTTNAPASASASAVTNTGDANSLIVGGIKVRWVLSLSLNSRLTCSGWHWNSHNCIGQSGNICLKTVRRNMTFDQDSFVTLVLYSTRPEYRHVRGRIGGSIEYLVVSSPSSRWQDNIESSICVCLSR